MTEGSLFDLAIIIGVPILAWRWVVRPLLAKWSTIRGITGIKLVGKRQDQDRE